ncbi:MAG: molecular chaperone DnaK [Verrucomicrobiales bacterium]|jgi:molecular chaperone DnaK
MSEPIIGIDLGTTNSAVAVVQDGRPIIIPVDGQPTMPSCVGLDANGTLVVGQPALNQLVASPESTVISVKRKMGTDIAIKLGEKSFSPEEISAFILGRLKEAAEEYLGQPVTKAVITVPAYFDEGQRKATADAAKLANLEAVRIINEPTAAALAYDAESAKNQTMLVYDLGGGTFDVSVVVVENGVVEVKASHGDTQLGGDDFDDALVAHVSDIFREAHGLTFEDDLKAQRRLKVALERAKCTLSVEPFVKVQEDFLKDEKHLTTEISREDYEEMIGDYLQKTLTCMHKAMEDAKVVPTQLDKILLVGGSSRTPAVSELIENLLGVSPSFEVNPDLIVAMGAAVQAGTLAGVKSQSILVDITPHTFSTGSLETSMGFPNEICVPLIKRNTPLPCRKAEVFYTMVDNQKEVLVTAFQGEGGTPEENTLVGDFMVQGLSRVPAGNPLVLEFELDLNGMLAVTATEKGTGLTKQVVMDTNSNVRTFDLEKARENIAELADSGEKVVPMLEVINDSNGPAITEAKQLRKRAEALITAGVDEDDKVEILGLVNQTTAAVKAGDGATISRLNQSLSDVLFYLED